MPILHPRQQCSGADRCLVPPRGRALEEVVVDNLLTQHVNQPVVRHLVVALESVLDVLAGLLTVAHVVDTASELLPHDKIFRSVGVTTGCVRPPEVLERI